MTKYKFDITQTLYGYIEAEIGNEDPDEYIDEMIENGISVLDFTYIHSDETECDGIDKV